MANKGSPFERQICDLLSQWWTGDSDNRVFWRSATSGGAATVRSRKGKQTTGHHGDITSSDPDALKLLSLVSIELKRGYSRASLLDLIDFSMKKMKSKRPPKPMQYELFLDQAMTSAERAGVPYWLLIHRKDSKDAIVIGPASLFDNLVQVGAKFTGPMLRAKLSLRRDNVRKKIEIIGMRLDTFRRCVSREHFLSVKKEYHV